MKKRLYFDIIVVFLLGLLPILWLPGQTLLLGHDAGLPFDPITHFLDRFYVWSQRLGIGTDQSYGLLGAILIHGIEAFLAWVGFSMKQVQIIQFVFWFVMPGFAMYFLTKNIWPEKKYLPLIASTVYMINFYLLQAWFVAERTKFTIYVAAPLVLYFAIFYLLGRISFRKGVIGIGVTLGLFNGGGSVPLYGGLIILISLLFLYWNFLNTAKLVLRKTILFLISIGSIYILLNAYWLFSYIYYIFGFYSRDLALAGGPGGALAWASYLSKGSTFLNLFRGQGIPDWYLNPYHSYATTYLFNPLFIVVSFIFPILAFSSLLLLRNKKDKFFIYFFVLLSLITLIFAAGPRSQLGIIYEALTQYVPGFAIFRSAYYKFNYTFFLGFGILIGFTLDFVFSKIETFIKQKNLSVIFSFLIVIVVIAGYLFYHYPILSGSFLDYSREPDKELTTRVTVPNYVYDFGKWANQQDFTKRYLIVPELSETGFIAYDWKYWSYAPVNSLQVKNSFVQNTFLVPQSERILMREMYKSLLRRDMSAFRDYSEVFAIDGIVLQEDFDWDNPNWRTTNPSVYKNILDESRDLKLIKTFGKWKVYDFLEKKSQRIAASSKFNFLQGKLENVVSFPYFDPRSPLFMSDQEPKNADYFLGEATDVFVAPDCIICDLTQEDFGFKEYKPKILPGSFIYPLILYRENRAKLASKTFTSLLTQVLAISDRRIIEAGVILDSKEGLIFLQLALDGYHKSIKELKEIVSRDWKADGREENKLARTINAHLLQQISLIDSIYENELLTADHRKSLAKTYDEMLKIKRESDRRLWLTEDINDKRYIFDLPKAGSYEIYVNKNALSDPLGDSSSSTITLSNGTILAPTSDKDGWLNFGKHNFNSTKIRLTFKDETLRNLIEGQVPDFPEGSSGVKVNNNEYGMGLESRNKCMIFTADNLETIGIRYLVSFNYRNLTDKQNLGFYITQTKEYFPKFRVKESFLQNTRAWANYFQLVTPIDDRIKLNFCNGFASVSQQGSVREKKELELLTPGQNLIEIRDISVYKIAMPSIVFYQSKKQILSDDLIIDYKKPNPVEYKINTKPANSPFTITMRESYAKYWRLCQTNGECLSFDDKNHFASAGFTNAWYFKNGVKSDLNIYYYPQKIYNVGAYLTIATVFIILGGICLNYIKRKL